MALDSRRDGMKLSGRAPRYRRANHAQGPSRDAVPAAFEYTVMRNKHGFIKSSHEGLLGEKFLKHVQCVLKCIYCCKVLFVQPLRLLCTN